MTQLYQKCPVCDGKGVLPYDRVLCPFGGYSNTAGPYPCHRCSGSGTIITPPIAYENSNRYPSVDW
jgi:DnaJ-class molecular chaperone